MTFGRGEKNPTKEESKLFVVDGSLAPPLPYCLLSVLISWPPFSHLKEIVLLDPPSPTSFHPPCLPPSVTPALPRLSSCGSAPEEDRGSWQREKQYKQSGGDIKCSSFSGARLSRIAARLLAGIKLG